VHKALLTLLVGFATVSLARETAAQPLSTRTVAFVDAVKFPPKAATQAHERLRVALEEALKTNGWWLALPRHAGDCGANTECMAKVASDANADYAIRISGAKIREYGYEITLDLYSTATGSLHSSLTSCDICDPERMSELASKSAVNLLASTLKEATSLKEKARQSAPPPVAAPIPSAPPPAAIAIPPSPTAESNHFSWIPWSMMGVGALTMAYGGWCLHKNGDSTGSLYPSSSSDYGHNTYSSKPLGLGTLIGGSALALVGLTWVILTPSHTVAVSASPDHVAFSLRF
jgi:hypothetical protein